MKQCPNCQQIFTDDDLFCHNDGSSLLLISESGRNVVPAFPVSGEMPTQYVPRPSAAVATGAPAAAKDSSKWLFLVIGVLATALVGMGIYLFTARGEKAETVARIAKPEVNGAQENRAATPTPAAPPASFSSPASAVAVPVGPKIDPNLSPSGNWAGDWSSKSTYFTATANLTETSGQVSGQIVWTLARTSNPKKTGKIGSTATEYVQGTFNPATRVVALRGVRKDDPNGIVILDRYNLSLAENNRTLSGRSINGNFVLRR
jgi:hypothetical protein